MQSGMSWRPREIKDRLLQGGGDRFIRTVRNAGRRVGAGTRGGSKAGGGKARGGVDLHFRGLQEPPEELEAILDDLDATSDPIFAAVESQQPPTYSSRQQQPVTRVEKQSQTTANATTAAFESDPLFVEEDGRQGVSCGATDSEESEDLELDEEEVMKSLKLEAVGENTSQDELFGDESPLSSWGERGRVAPGQQKGTETSMAINNESANNNTHFHGEKPSHILSADTDVPHLEPTLDELLEKGSAALGSRSYSSSPHVPSGSPLAAPSPSSLTSSGELDPSHPLCDSSGSRTLRAAAPSSVRKNLAATHIGFNSTASNSDEKSSVQEQASSSGRPLHHPTPFLSQSPEKNSSTQETRAVTQLSTGEHEDSSRNCSASATPHVADEEDDLFPDDAKAAKSAGVSERLKAAMEDDLFPDDRRVQPDSSESARTVERELDSLDIREDHFSPSPEQQRREKQSQRPSNEHPPTRATARLSPAPSRGLGRPNSAGKMAPPRPPQSPLLASRLKLRQQKEREALGHSTTNSSAVHQQTEGSSPPQHRQNDDTASSTVQPLSKSPPPKTTTDTSETASKYPLSRSPSEPPETVSNPQPLAPQAATDVTTTASLDQTAQEIDNIELPFLPLHVHIPLALILYLYYTFNPFLYLGGLAAGFLLFYLCLGAVFVAYVQREKEEEEGSLSGDPVAQELSAEFMRSMDIRVEDYETRFIAPSRNNRFEFTATLHYDAATHHRRDRLKCKLKLINDYELFVHISDSEGDKVLKKTFNVYKEKAKITIVPDDVFENRKRRWSKKYPIRVEVGGYEIFLFANVSRFKQEWFFRLREAAKGFTTRQLVTKQRRFYKYMQRYFSGDFTHRNSASSVVAPPTSLASSTSYRQPRGGSVSSVSSSSVAASSRPTGRHHHSQRKFREEGAVQYSTGADKEEEMTGGSISISSPHSREPTHSSITSSASSLSEQHPHPRPISARSVSSNSGLGPTIGGPSSFESYWINALTARLYWDVWHEERWKEWIVTRIERKLVRIKTPRFLDPLQLTDISIGESMPVINQLYEGPYLRVDGVWVYLEVEYEGEFVMTIKTRLKLSRGKDKEEGTEMKAVKHHSRLSHSQAAVRLQDSTGMEPDDSDSGSEEEEDEEEENSYPLTSPLEEEVEGEGERAGEESEKLTVGTSHSTETQPVASKKRERRAKLKKVVSNITKRVANNRLVRRATERAVEKAAKIPLELTVEVRKLKGILVINIPPPTSDTIWYGFQTTPKLDLVARPKLGKRAVTFSQITHWIERKLCSLVDEKLTLPNMEDLVIPVLNSGVTEDTQKPLP